MFNMQTNYISKFLGMATETYDLSLLRIAGLNQGPLSNLFPDWKSFCFPNDRAYLHFPARMEPKCRERWAHMPGISMLSATAQGQPVFSLADAGSVITIPPMGALAARSSAEGPQVLSKASPGNALWETLTRWSPRTWTPAASVLNDLWPRKETLRFWAYASVFSTSPKFGNLPWDEMENDKGHFIRKCVFFASNCQGAVLFSFITQLLEEL